MSVTRIEEFKNRETIETLEELLDQAKKGQIHGFLFCARQGEKSHLMGLSGDYRDDAILAVAVAARMIYRLNTMVDEAEQFTTSKKSEL